MRRFFFSIYSNLSVNCFIVNHPHCYDIRNYLKERSSVTTESRNTTNDKVDYCTQTHVNVYDINS